MNRLHHNGKYQHHGAHRHNGRHRHDGKAHAQDGKPTKKRQAEKDLAASYERFKEFEGQRYTGTRVGRSMKWYYDKGEWKDKKITPDKWQISYAVTKRRAGRAPEGSGVPVGTEYHWYIVAHQIVKKLNANDYSTSLVGTKFKVAHKRAGSEKWSASDSAQRRRMIKFLQEMIEALEEQGTQEKQKADTPQARSDAKRGRAPAKKPVRQARRKALAA